MGGHGGLNILPQKRWNVYNFDNREKVRKDEEAAAKEEQIKREQSRKRDTEFRIEQLRQARGLPSHSSSSSQPKPEPDPPKSEPKPEPEPEEKSKHINLFEGIRILDPVEVGEKRKVESADEKRKGFKRMKKEAESVRAVLPEDEKYRLGYGVAGKGVKLPWYMEKRSKKVDDDDDEVEEGCGLEMGSKSGRKKSVEELREERLKREAREKERERALMRQNGRGALVRNEKDGRFSRRR